ncbi:MAG TPA: zinc ribbon domain-containing protein [Burkholderiales bacterium]|nr:zinc ribbon domain-containing protein [Burkholderiales bacterium]
MKRETLPGEAPVAAPVAIARNRSRCLACKHENTSGERFCEACGSSLNLRFCAACEAVNADTAVTCYSCGAALGAAASSQIEAESSSEIGAKAGVALPNARRSRLRWALSLAALLGLTVLTYQYFSQGAPTAVVEGKDESARAPVAAPLSSEPAPVRDAASVAATPAGAGQSTGATSTPKASLPQGRVTHTRPTEAGGAGSPQPALPAPAAGARAPTPECSEAIAALALCPIRDNKGGK